MKIWSVGTHRLSEVRVPFYYDVGGLAVHQTYYSDGFADDEWNITHPDTGSMVGPIFHGLFDALTYARRIEGIIPEKVSSFIVTSPEIKDDLGSKLGGLEYHFGGSVTSLEAWCAPQ